MEEKVSQKPYKLEPNIEAALSYLLAPFTGIVVFIFEKENKFVRFHAFQSILFGIAGYALYFVSSILVVALIGFILIPVVVLVLFLYWLLVMWKAYNNIEYQLPIIGKIARDQVNK